MNTKDTKKNICILLSMFVLLIISGCQDDMAKLLKNQIETTVSIVVYDVDPIRNPEVRTCELSELEKYSSAEFDYDTFISVVEECQFVKKRGLSKTVYMGGNLGIVKLPNEEIMRVAVLYNGFLYVFEGKYYLEVKNPGLAMRYKTEHERIVQKIFIPNRRNKK